MSDELVTLITNPPPLLLEDLVLSADSIEKVGERHGVDPELMKVLYTHPIFSSKLANTKAMQEKTGEFHRTLARHHYPEALDNMRLKALDARTSPKDAIAYADHLASVGEIKRASSQLAVEGGGSSFHFTINMPGGDTLTVGGTREQDIIEGSCTYDGVEPEPLPIINASPSEFEFTD